MTRLKDLLDYLDYLDSCSDSQFLKFCDAMEKRGYQFVTQYVLDYDYPHVTHCKDCKYHHEAHYEEDGEDPIIKHKCKLMKGYQFSENHYCGFAERKEDD